MPPGDVFPFFIVMTLVLSAAMVLILLGPVGKALARRLEGPSAGLDRIREELEELRAHAVDSEALAARVAELEERVDFSERLLAQQNPAQIGERHHG